MTNAIMITKDEDFAGLAKADRVASVVWLRSGNSPRRVLIEQMESVFKDICAALASGEMIVEVGRDG